MVRVVNREVEVRRFRRLSDLARRASEEASLDPDDEERQELSEVEARGCSPKRHHRKPIVRLNHVRVLEFVGDRREVREYL